MNPLRPAVTTLVHGAGVRRDAVRAGGVMCGGGLDGLSDGTFREVIGELPTFPLESSRLGDTGLRLTEDLCSPPSVPGKARRRGKRTDAVLAVR